MKPDLKVFVYGTLKTGFHNHARFCQGVAEVQNAMVMGRLYDVGVGFPALEIPADSILEVGSNDHLDDIAVQEKFRSRHEKSRILPSIEGDWGYVYGEILTFRYPAPQFARLDQLEGFQASRTSFYNRVLALAEWNEQTEPVWMYVMEDFRGKRRILDGVWR